VQLSLTPVLVAIELGFLLFLVRHAAREARLGGAALAYWLWLVAYAVATAVLGAGGVYISGGLLPWVPALWLQLVTVAAFVVPVLSSGPLRAELRLVADATPWHRFAYFHALRIAALGTAYKTWIGEFPVSFELLVGVPDFLFGTSALWVGRLAVETWCFEEEGEVYCFPRDAKGEALYCNVEGVAWLDDSHVLVVSDRRKSSQPRSCVRSDQSIHVFRLP